MKNISKIVSFQSGHDADYCIPENEIPAIHQELKRYTRKKHALGDGLKMFYEKFLDNKSDLKNIFPLVILAVDQENGNQSVKIVFMMNS